MKVIISVLASILAAVKGAFINVEDAEIISLHHELDRAGKVAKERGLELLYALTDKRLARKVKKGIYMEYMDENGKIHGFIQNAQGYSLSLIEKCIIPDLEKYVELHNNREDSDILRYHLQNLQVLLSMRRAQMSGKDIREIVLDIDEFIEDATITLEHMIEQYHSHIDVGSDIALKSERTIIRSFVRLMNSVLAFSRLSESEKEIVNGKK